MKTTVGDQQFLSRLGHIAYGLIGFNISDDGAYRHPDIQVFTAFTGTIPTLAVFTAFGLEYPGMTEIDQGVQVGVAYQINTAAITAITTVRPRTEQIQLLACQCLGESHRETPIAQNLAAGQLRKGHCADVSRAGG